MTSTRIKQTASSIQHNPYQIFPPLYFRAKYVSSHPGQLSLTVPLEQGGGISGFIFDTSRGIRADHRFSTGNIVEEPSSRLPLHCTRLQLPAQPHGTSPSLDQYPCILRDNSGTCVWTICPETLDEVEYTSLMVLRLPHHETSIMLD